MGQVGAGEVFAQAAGPVLGAVGVGLARTGAGQGPEFRDHGSGDSGVLADVEGVGAKAEDLGLPAERRDVARGEAVCTQCVKTVFENAEIIEEMADRGVTARPAFQHSAEAVADGGEGLAEKLSGVAGGQRLRARGGGGDAVDAFREVRRKGHDPRGDAKTRGGGGHGVKVAREDRVAGPGERVAGGFRGDVGVAVAVAADPGVEADAGGGLQAVTEAGGGGGGETVEDLGDGVVKRVAEELQAPFDLVREARAFDA
jgi:hypothetical protein